MKTLLAILVVLLFVGCGGKDGEYVPTNNTWSCDDNTTAFTLTAFSTEIINSTISLNINDVVTGNKTITCIKEGVY